jgi:hypothetical protein
MIEQLGCQEGIGLYLRNRQHLLLAGKADHV